MDERKGKRDALLTKLKMVQTKVSKAQEIFHDLSMKAMNIQSEFDTLDREIAMENRTILPSRKTTTKRLDFKSFTLDEVKSIAVKLGVEITIKEEDEK